LYYVSAVLSTMTRPIIFASNDNKHLTARSIRLEDRSSTVLVSHHSMADCPTRPQVFIWGLIPRTLLAYNLSFGMVTVNWARTEELQEVAQYASPTYSWEYNEKLFCECWTNAAVIRPVTVHVSVRGTCKRHMTIDHVSSHVGIPQSHIFLACPTGVKAGLHCGIQDMVKCKLLC